MNWIENCLFYEDNVHNTANVLLTKVYTYVDTH